MTLYSNMTIALNYYYVPSNISNTLNILIYITFMFYKVSVNIMPTLQMLKLNSWMTWLELGDKAA